MGIAILLTYNSVVAIYYTPGNNTLVQNEEDFLVIDRQSRYESPAKRGYVYPKGFGPIRQSGITTFEPVEGGTLLRFTAHIEARFPLNLLLPLLEQLMRRQNDKSFAILKRLFETSATSPEKRIS